MLAKPLSIVAMMLVVWAVGTAQAGEELITTAQYPDGKTVPYILNKEGDNLKFVIILFPGGTGVMDPRMVDGKLEYRAGGNFLIRSRKHIVDIDFATVSTDASQSEERIQAILNDLEQRYPRAQVYLMGTSRGTHDTMHLSKYLEDKIAGVIHTASLSDIGSFDARKYRNRHLLVHHRRDVCHATPFNRAEYSQQKYGNELIVMEGGKSVGDDCQARSYHGFNGIERETMGRIKEWIRRGTGETN